MRLCQVEGCTERARGSLCAAHEARKYRGKHDPSMRRCGECKELVHDPEIHKHGSVLCDTCLLKVECWSCGDPVVDAYQRKMYWHAKRRGLNAHPWCGECERLKRFTCGICGEPTIVSFDTPRPHVFNCVKCEKLAVEKKRARKQQRNHERLVKKRIRLEAKRGELKSRKRIEWLLRRERKTRQCRCTSCRNGTYHGDR